MSKKRTQLDRTPLQEGATRRNFTLFQLDSFHYKMRRYVFPIYLEPQRRSMLRAIHRLRSDIRKLTNARDWK